MLRWSAIALGFVLLTALSQVGGAVLLATLAVSRWAGRDFGRPTRFALALVSFAVLHFGVSELVLPSAAPLLSGRVRLPCQHDPRSALRPASQAFCLLNRNYVTPELRDLASTLAANLRADKAATTLYYLDGGFPFAAWMPMLPHLGHRDGRALDLAFLYLDPTTGKPLAGTPSAVGYWAFERPRGDAADPCPEPAGSWPPAGRWDLDWLQPVWGDWRLDEARTRAMLAWLATEGPARGVERIFLEPHLAERLGVASPLLRFAGCEAARHDDHVHVEMSRR